jgi:hypothetical protein
LLKIAPQDARPNPPRSGAEAMSCHQSNAGAVAFSRTGDPTLGEFEDAVILKTFGDVPVDFGTPESA